VCVGGGSWESGGRAAGQTVANTEQGWGGGGSGESVWVWVLGGMLPTHLLDVSKGKVADSC
jgi:hypothetical protein